MHPQRSTGGARPSSSVAHRTTCSQSLPTRTYMNVIEGNLPVTSVNSRTSSLHTSLAHRSTGMHKVIDSWGKEDLAHRATDRSLSLTRSSSAPYKPNQKLQIRSQGVTEIRTQWLSKPPTTQTTLTSLLVSVDKRGRTT